MATFTSAPPQHDIDKDAGEHSMAVRAATPEIGVQLHRTSVGLGSRIEFAIFAFFVAMLAAALLAASDALLQAAGVKQAAAYDFCRAALLWGSFVAAQSTWHARNVPRVR